MKIKSLLLGAVAAIGLASFFGAASAVTPPAVLRAPVGRPHRGGKMPGPRRAPSKALRRQIAKEREIGIDPKYRNRRSENGPAVRLEWALRSREWERAHG